MCISNSVPIGGVGVEIEIDGSSVSENTILVNMWMASGCSVACIT